MAGARLRSNEFFSAERERTKINLNLADGNLLTYHERLLGSVLSFFLACFCTATAEAGAGGRSLISPAGPFIDGIPNKVRERVASRAPATFYLSYRFAPLQRSRPFAPQIDTIPPWSGTAAPG